MEKHSLNFFPEMLQEDYQRLKDDMEQNGYDPNYPIWFYEGRVLDGWNREKICTELHIEPVYAEFIGTTTEAIEFVMRSNKRRNLTSSQWAALAVESDEIINKLKKEARDRQIDGGRVSNLLEKLDENEKIHTDKELAKLFNTNDAYIFETRKLKNEKPELFEAVKRGEKTITEVKKEEKIEERNKQIEEIKRKIENENLIITGKYDVIVIDPPWAYEEKGGLSITDYDPEVTRGECPYPTMKLNQIKNIELPYKENCVLFLWTTHAFLRNAFDLLDMWGFKYKATIVWDKEKMGMGRTIRLQCEFCLLAIKGAPVIKGDSERDIIREVKREHSRKPELFYLMVERMTTGRKLDYFAREKRERWDVYGIESGKF